ncbi:O-antigen ligase family protein, partial [Candidatus Zixiibacteriota bacterium]
GRSKSRIKPGYKMPHSVLLLCLFPLVLAAAIIIAGRRPQDSLKILVIVIPFQAFGAIEAGFTIPPAYLVLFTILMGVVARGEFLSTKAPGGKRIALYLGIAVLATVLAAFGPALSREGLDVTMRYRAGPWRSPIQLGLLFFHFAVFFVVVRYVRNRDTADSLLKVHLWMALLLGVFGVYQIFAFTFGLPFSDCTWSVNLLDRSSTIDYSSTRLYSAQVAGFSTRATFRESRDFADYLLSAVPITMAFCVSGSAEIRRRFGFLASPLAAFMGLAAIFFTMSRSGWILIAFALVIIALRLSRRVFYIYLPLMFIMLAAVSLVLAKAGFFNSTVMTLGEIITGRLDPYFIINDARVGYFLLLAESLQAHPLLGLGAGNFALWGAAMTGSSLVHSAHGFLWVALADFGLLGCAALVFVFAGIFRRLHRAIRKAPRRSAQNALLAGIFAALSAAFINAMFGGDRPFFHLLLIMGLAMAYSSMPTTRTTVEDHI